MNTNLISAALTTNTTSLPSWLEYASKMAPLITALAVLVAFFTAGVAFKNLRAIALFKLFEEWRSQEVYEAVLYINRLLREWKQDGREVEILAKEWVKKHFTEDPTISEGVRKHLRTENQYRRCAAQFLAKMYAAVLKGYLNADQLFEVIPETGRYLAVLAPLDDAIKCYFEKKEDEDSIGWNGKKWDKETPKRIADWDRVCPKWEFRLMIEAYEKWFKQNKSKFEPIGSKAGCKF